MAPRALQRTASSKESLDGVGAEVSNSAVDSQLEPITLHVFRGRRRILETALEMGTTVKDVKLQVERTTGIPGSCQIIAFKGRPLCSSAVVRTCLKFDTVVTVREADESWVQALEELKDGGPGGIATLKTGLGPTGPVARCDAVEGLSAGFNALLSKMDQIQCAAACSTANYKRATGKVMASANLLENAAEHLQRNRSVVFEVPRGSKGARKAAEDLMICRNALLSATHSNGLVLSAEEMNASMNKSFTADLLELRAALRRANELLLRRSEVLHLQRFGGGLRHEDVEQQLQQCQEELVALEGSSDHLEKTCQELVAARRNYKLAMRSNLLAIKRASEYLQQDERVVLSWALDHVSKRRTLDRDFMLTVVQSNGEALEEAAPQLQQDREVVSEALRSSKGWALQFAADELKRDRDIVLTAVRRSGLCLQFAAGEMRGDRDVVLAAVQVDGEALEFASQELREDEAVVLAAMQTSRGWALQYASEALRSNRKVVLEALRENGLMLEHASQDLQGDPEIVRVAVTSNSSALQFASDKLKNNRTIVLKAVSKDGFALRFASSLMKADREVAAVAVKQAGEYALIVADQSEGESGGRGFQMDTANTGSPGSTLSEGFVEVSEVSWSNTGFEKTHL